MYGDAKRRDVLLLLLAADPTALAVAPPPTGQPKRSASVNGFSRIDNCSHRHPPFFRNQEGAAPRHKSSLRLPRVATMNALQVLA